MLTPEFFFELCVSLFFELFLFQSICISVFQAVSFPSYVYLCFSSCFFFKLCVSLIFELFLFRAMCISVFRAVSFSSYVYLCFLSCFFFELCVSLFIYVYVYETLKWIVKIQIVSDLTILLNLHISKFHGSLHKEKYWNHQNLNILLMWES